jgi:hypothetical protein
MKLLQNRDKLPTNQGTARPQGNLKEKKANGKYAKLMIKGTLSRD